MGAFDPMLPDTQVHIKDLSNPDPTQTGNPPAAGGEGSYHAELAGLFERMTTLYNDRRFPSRRKPSRASSTRSRRVPSRRRRGPCTTRARGTARSTSTWALCDRPSRPRGCASSRTPRWGCSPSIRSPIPAAWCPDRHTSSSRTSSRRRTPSCSTPRRIHRWHLS
jgi:hypothetical protein